MKINWGTGIAIFYSLFVILMITAVIKASQLGVPLVQDEYYSADINYEEFRQQRAKALGLENPPQIKLTKSNKLLNVKFDTAAVIDRASVHFYRPSDNVSDQKDQLSIKGKNVAEMNVAHLKKGRWQMMLHWSQNGESYFWKEDLHL